MIYTRVSYNNQDWINPSGSEGKSKSNTTFESSGFGMEEWLFNDLFLKEGYHYGYIEGLKDYKEGDENELLILFSIRHPTKDRYIVATIDKWNKVDTTEGGDLIKDFNQEISEIRNEVSNLQNINIELALQNFDRHILNNTFFNIKFKVFELLNGEPLSADHPVQNYYRVQMNNRNH